MDPQIVVKGRGDFRQLNADISRTEGQFSKLGAGIKRGLIGAGVAGTAALVKLGTASVGLASDAQQSIGATESVFGKYADTVIKRSGQAADAIGLSANEYRELSNVTGAMLASAGTPLQKVANLTDRLNRRAADMAATFGGTTKDAVSAVSSLLRGEADPIERYGVSIKQSDVNARLAAKGLDKLEGSARKQAEQTERLHLLFGQTKKSAGQFASESDTLAGAQQRLGAKAKDLGAKFGTLLIPMLTDATNWASRELVPALDDLQGWLEDNKDEIADFGGTIKDTALPPLKDTVGLVKDAIGFFSGLPGPVKELGIQVGIAALVFPRLSAGVTGVTGSLATMRAEMQASAAQGTLASTAVSKLAGAVKAAAGIGGMVALTRSASETNDGMKLLERSAGLVAVGFSMGGPWGAGVGAVGALAFAMKDAAGKPARDLRAALAAQREEAKLYKDSMDQVTGAITEATRASALKVLQDNDVLQTGLNLGLTQRELVSASLGQVAASRKLSDALFAQGLMFDDTGKAVVQYGDTGGILNADLIALSQTIGINTERTRLNAKELRNVTKVSIDFGKSLNGLPDKKRLAIEAVGVLPTTRGIAKLANRFDLLPRTVRAIIRETGADTTGKKVQRLREQLKATDTKVTLKGWVASIQTAIDKGANITDREKKLIVKKLEAIKEANPNMASYVNSVKRSVNNAKTEAAGSTKVGNQLKQGLLNGMAGTSSALTAIMSGAVRDAIAAARKAADSHSPSRKTMELGRDLGAGLQIGLARTAPAQRKAGRDAVGKIIAGMDAGASEARGTISKINDLIRKNVNLKNDKDERAREKKIIENLRGQYRELVKIGRGQDSLSKQLEKQKRQLSEVRDWAGQVKAAFIDAGNVVNLGQLEDGTVSGTLLLDQMRDKVSNAERFSSILHDLTDNVGPKLNKISLQQLLDAGPEAGLATAEAMAAGGDAAITELNKLSKELASIGGGLASDMSKQFFDVGLQASIGLVKGLEARQDKVDRIAKRLADKLADAVRKALGIHSPSKVFEGIGGNVLKGLDIGLSDTHVRRSGERVSSALVKGFGSPTLGAAVPVAMAGAGQAQAFTIRLAPDVVTGMQRGQAYTADVQVVGAVGARRVAVRRS